MQNSHRQGAKSENRGGAGQDRRTGFTLRELEVLRALIETGKSTSAARRLGLSQPAVSRSLAQLEAQLGRQLFDRVSGRLIPTADGLAVNEELSSIFASLARISDRSARRAGGHFGTFRIAAPPTIAHRFLPPWVARFTKANPELEVLFDVLSGDALITGVAEARYDIAMTDTVPAHDGVRTDLLLATEAICALPTRHRLAGQKSIHAEDLEGEPFVALTRRHTGRIAVDRLFERAGVERKIMIEAATAVSATEFVREGLGVALLNPFPIVHQLGTGIVVRPFAPAVPYRTFFVFPSSEPQTPAVIDFMNMIRSSMGGSMQADLSEE
ncbi:LysR substrate-binding domain-containing protein [Chelativorans sp. YIM 93263]|uniref:LysR substrate-binding domain-containing protein n=1 Tax=Chelativorans sp. YIM 93263 TaxID=2906648 RepID=UPI002378696F|nr:LysR substrate-binding domain-containing protein [Chelativorans sp. YIM 93263]